MGWAIWAQTSQTVAHQVHRHASILFSYALQAVTVEPVAVVLVVPLSLNPEPEAVSDGAAPVQVRWRHLWYMC